MNILIASSKLADVTRTAARSVPHQRDRKRPVLNCCRLTAGGNSLSICGTDLATGIAAWVDCDVIEPGEAAVDAHKLVDIAGKLKGDIRLGVDNGNLVLKCGRSRFTLTVLAAEDYPPAFKIDDGVPSIELGAADIMALFAGAAGAAASTDTRIYLAGAALFGEPTDFGHRLCGVGTDAIALSYAATAVACPDLGKGVLIHRDTCKLAVSLFGKAGAEIRLSENLVQLATGNVRLVSKLIGAEPIAWHSMVPPAEVGNVALVKRVDLLNALEQCAAVYNNLPHKLGAAAAKQKPSVRIRWNAGDRDGLRVSYGDIRAPWSALVTIPDQALSGHADISVSPIMLMRLLEGIEVPELNEIDRAEGIEPDSISLSVGARRGDPLRVDASPDRFVVLGQMREFSTVEDEAA
jgi:DNA polymerase III sliding clamp (beta) subunit (PCNA family)